MASSKRLIVGLGNPGQEYENTRHNVGFVVADRVAEKAGITLKSGKGNTMLGWGQVKGDAFGVAKPMTYMNRSGQAVQYLLHYFKIKPDEMLVVADDLNLSPGTIRVRARGSAGGHNGLQDIIDAIGGNDFPRLRIGIGSNFRRGRQADYVLSPFSPDEQVLAEEALTSATEAALAFVHEGIVPVMNRFNRK